MEKKYRLVLKQLMTDDQIFARRLAEVGVQKDIVVKMIERIPVIVKTGLSLGEARMYAETLQRAGGRVIIQETERIQASPKTNNSSIIPLKAFVLCPRCGMKQPGGIHCVRCGSRIDRSREGNGNSVTSN